jgi:hypothetical protein
MPESSGDIFVNARYQEVFFNMGRFDDKSNVIKMVRAPFNLLNMPNAPTAARTLYLEPRGFGGDASGVRQTDNVSYETMLGNQGLAWLSGDNVVLDPADMGDTRDDWRGLHHFSFI